MECEKNSDTQLSKDGNRPVDCPSDCQKAESKENRSGKCGSMKEGCKGYSSLGEQKTRLLHSISQNLGGDRGLHYEPMSDLFLKRNNWFQQEILDLLPALTLEILSDFQELSKFAKAFLNRTQYQCNSMLYRFLSDAAESIDPEIDPVSYADLLNGTLFTEIQSVNDAVAMSSTIQDANRNYEWWFADSFFGEEAP